MNRLLIKNGNGFFIIVAETIKIELGWKSTVWFFHLVSPFSHKDTQKIMFSSRQYNLNSNFDYFLVYKRGKLFVPGVVPHQSIANERNEVSRRYNHIKFTERESIIKWMSSSGNYSNIIVTVTFQITWHFSTAVFPDITYSSCTCTVYSWLTTANESYNKIWEKKEVFNGKFMNLSF